ncbi:hypothetical protein ABEV74_02485 [Paenibacillus cisolokensis]|jgi:hypothetical protein|uniref:Uncharacterized protein n=1 Tax=Paenibacillus cisolokensis TaxID=1658519 RepID=A0ABQ4N0K0_9BACL|nr:MULTISPECIES: hypothetical protein [Paenibacillus]ALS27733.1 hypothetical protein IJ21_23360 [Paenibacillus sp. 32O-W]GIQ61718.1 hypothetical protein PACILC2_02860 [Paenibacillus cisolokensis]
MSRVEKFGTRKRRGTERMPSDGAWHEGGLPPRRTKHPSNKQQMAKWFYNTLFVLFLILVAGLIWWGGSLADSEPLPARTEGR